MKALNAIIIVYLCVLWHSEVGWRIVAPINLTIIGSDHGLWPVQCRAFIWINADLLSIAFGIGFRKRRPLRPYSTTVYPKKYAHGFCFAVLCCGYTLTDFPISIRLTSLALWQSNDCPSASKATLMKMDKCFMWIHYERLRNHNKAKHNKTVCIFLGIYCMLDDRYQRKWNI